MHTVNILPFYFIFQILLRKYIKVKVSSWYFEITFFNNFEALSEIQNFHLVKVINS